MNGEALKYYTQQKELLESSLQQLKRRTSRLYLVRFVIFMLFGTSFLLLFSGDMVVLYALLSLLFLTAFLSITIYDLRAWERKRELQCRIQFNENELRSLNYDFYFRQDGAHFSQCNPHLSADFDIFGKGSLYQYLNRSVSQGGRSRFAAALVACEQSYEVIKKRQEAIKELGGKQPFLESFVAIGSQIHESGSEVERLLEWLREDSSKERFIGLARFVMPLLTLGSLVLAIFGVVPYTLLTLMFLASLAAVFSANAKLNRAHALLGRSAKIFDKYAALIKLIEREKFEGELLAAQRAKLSTGEHWASESILQLKGLLNRFDYRCNVYVSFILNGFLSFDFHTYMALLSWKSKHRDYVESWFDALYSVDSLLGLGLYAYNCGDATTYATAQEGDFSIAAHNMGHPLISADLRVNNSIEIAGKPSVVIITGANMAGKSTFLRTLAVNLILAMNGAPVPSDSFSFTPTHLLSSIKIQDSLMNRESYFYAELLRLSAILESLESEPNSMIILDEILRGTNTRDKQQGSIGLLKKIIDKRGVAIIATHDLVIGKIEEDYPQNVANYCFEVEIDGDQLSFDYKLKEGISSKLNASFLMRRMGIID